METEFWIKAWNEGRTNFHQESYNPKLVKYFPTFKPQAQQKVLVPLCGKTKDLLWLQSLNQNVHGFELHQQAVEDFFTENNLAEPNKSQNQNFTTYTKENISISCGDFFDLKESNQYDYIYDRAALVALPKEVRINYSNILKQTIKVGGKYLLIVYEYDQSQMQGPPFSINEKEIRDLYQDQFKIELIESGRPEFNANNKMSTLSTIKGLSENVYILEKI